MMELKPVRFVETLNKPNRTLNCMSGQSGLVRIYLLDFVCIKCKLSIEVDGESHNTSNQIEYDIERTTYLLKLGIQEIRFTNEEVDSDLDGVVEIITEHVKNRLK